MAICSGGTVPVDQQREPGDAVTFDWSGGDVPRGGANVTVPATVEIGAVPASHAMGGSLEIAFSGGSSGGEVQMSLAKFISGSLVIIDCSAPMDAGKVVVPSEMFLMFEAGAAELTFNAWGRQVFRSGAWEIEALAHGQVQQGGAPIAGPIGFQLTQ